ncbi:flagellar P-ring protein precursor FlgI [Fodinibius sediminis]|uniref:Flagellar P-ring protein n=2 Tax=Fodinibius sediminis TaxID=1214077 RepID=A0A521CH87_9BACT|nr:flagellar P-ring protein precursor FlgI [Fodinibius sediminis]
MNKLAICFFGSILFFVLGTDGKAQTKISELVNIENAQRIELIGYGLVTGLDRSGDRTMGSRGSAFTVQSIASMLDKFGVSVNPGQLRTRNVAAVMVTAKVTPYHAPGSELDITVSSLGDASSLRGGVLMQTPLLNPQTQKVYAYAQGPLVQGGFESGIPGARVSRNQSLTATVPAGASVVANNIYTPSRDQPLGLVLRKPNYSNARRIAEAINGQYEEEIAAVSNAGNVRVAWPEGFESTGDLNFFTSNILDLEVEVETPARVVINERTGTIVAGGDVEIGEVLVSHGNIQIETQRIPFVSQPPALSGGETVQGSIAQVKVNEERAQNMVIEPNTRVTELSQSLTDLGLSARDIISIFQAIDKAGALKGKLIVM